MNASCIFCRIMSGEIPGKVVYEDETVYAFHDAHPVAPVHVLVIPRRHIPSLAELTPDDGPLLAALMQTCNRVARELGIAESGYRVVTNTGAGAGQSVFHLHFHVIGGRALRWPPG